MDPGGVIAAAAREGWKASWRGYEPPLPQEVPDNIVEGQLTLGLAGLETAFEDGLDPGSLTPAEAHIASRYAVRAINRLPAWLTGVAQDHPEPVREVLRACVEWEWRVSAEQLHVIGVLNALGYAAPDLRALALPIVLGCLQTGDPPNRDVLNQALTVLLAQPADGAEAVRTLAPRRILRYARGEGQFMVWLMAWLAVDGTAAVAFLEANLRDEPAGANVFVEALAGNLYGGRHQNFPTLSNPSYLSATPLACIVPLLHDHIRVEDDIDRTGTGAYSPTPRDHAQHARGGLLQSLAQTPEPAAFGLLAGLRDDPRMADRRDWIEYLLGERAGRDAEEPWMPSDVAEFELKYERPPRSADDLFRITLGRLDDLRNLVEDDDFSARGEIDGSEPEHELQLWIASKLKEASRGRYDVVREPEVDLCKRPDFRLVAADVDPTTIEVKWAHSWTYEDLREALVDQLVGKYLRSNQSRHGILLIANGRKGRRWQLSPDKSLDFPALVESLQAEAHTLLHERDRLDGLEVVGIDFVPDARLTAPPRTPPAHP